MNHHAKSIRAFVGSKNFEESRQFYRDLNFKESVISNDMSLFTTSNLGFYLQDYYVKSWVDNTMIFLEVDDAARYWKELNDLDLTSKYKKVRLTPMKEYDWGRECFLHDPSGVLWHFGEFYQTQ